MEESDDIIVFRKYDSSIDANLAKTKLDAYGIPCFLTEENLTNLYPLQNLLLFGVRLHIFRNDLQTAERVLNENMDVRDDSLICPACRSGNVSFGYSQKLSGNAGRMFMAFLALALMPAKKVYRCGDCHREFETL